jgi:lysophospholipase L1-like esterase
MGVLLAGGLVPAGVFAQAAKNVPPATGNTAGPGVTTSVSPAAGHAGSQPGLAWSKQIASRIDAFTEQDRMTRFAPNGIVFVGSSIFEQWTAVAQQMAPLPVLNRAIGGTRTSDQLQYMDLLALKYHPRILAYYCGSNDINEGADAATLVANFQKYVDRIAVELPETKILFVSINRAPQKKSRWNIVDEANAAIQAHAAKSHGRVTYVDVNSALFDARGEPRLELYQDDQLHFKPAAYVEFTKIIKPVLQKLWDE